MLHIYKTDIHKIKKNTSEWTGRMISKETGIPENEISYEYNEYGKPRLADALTDRIGTFEFNLSHSKDYAVLAVSDKPVGIDIEYLRKNRLSVAERFFCKEEYEDILSFPKEEQDKLFMEYWTMKEAYVKYLGTGIHTSFDSFLIKRLGNGISVIEKDSRYCLTCFPDAEYCISICADSEAYLKNSIFLEG